MWVNGKPVKTDEVRAAGRNRDDRLYDAPRQRVEYCVFATYLACRST